jgi:hypothetical protein
MPVFQPLCTACSIQSATLCFSVLILQLSVCSHKPLHINCFKYSVYQECETLVANEPPDLPQNIRSEANARNNFPLKDERWNHTQPSWQPVPRAGCHHNWTAYIHCFPSRQNVHTRVAFNWPYVRPLLQHYWRGLISVDMDTYSSLLAEILLHIFQF